MLYWPSTFHFMSCFAFCFLVFALTPFNTMINNLGSPCPSTKDQTWTTEVRALGPRFQNARELLTPGVLITENFDTCTQSLVSRSYWQHPLQDTLRKQQARQKQSSAYRSPIDTPKYTSHSPAHLKKKPHLLPLEHRYKSPQKRSPHKPLNQPFPPRAKTKGRRNTTQKVGERRPQTSKLESKQINKRRNIAQMKEQGRNSQDQINKEEISKLPEKEFRIMIVKMFQALKVKWRK